MNTATRIRRSAIAVTAAALLPLGLAACSSDGGDNASEGSTSSAPEKTDQGEKSEEAGKQEQASGPFGPACSAVPDDGKGSFDGMSKDPVATAASNNPELSTLVTAVKKAGLVDTLNSQEDITVFAPTNAAFEKIPQADLDKILQDKEQLTKILTYHVVGEPVMKDGLADGTYTTLEKSELTTKGSGESYKVNGDSSVVCGDIETANATVHLVDSVLMPPE